MGPAVGAAEGATEGPAVGPTVGTVEGPGVGAADGAPDVGDSVGPADGVEVGATDGPAVGATEGAALGDTTVGAAEGAAVGAAVGGWHGRSVMNLTDVTPCSNTLPPWHVLASKRMRAELTVFTPAPASNNTLPLDVLTGDASFTLLTTICNVARFPLVLSNKSTSPSRSPGRQPAGIVAAVALVSKFSDTNRKSLPAVSATFKSIVR